MIPTFQAAKAAVALAICKSTTPLQNPWMRSISDQALVHCRTKRNWFWWPRTRSETECVCVLLNPGTCHHCFRGTFNAECLAPHSSTAPAITYFSLECVSAASSAAYVRTFPVPSAAKQLQRRFLGLFQGLQEYLNTSRESRELSFV